MMSNNPNQPREYDAALGGQDIYKKLGWLSSAFDTFRFTFKTAPIGSLPWITGKEIRGEWYYQIPLIYRSDL